jgi:hypothetical protein
VASTGTQPAGTIVVTAAVGSTAVAVAVAVTPPDRV